MWSPCPTDFFWLFTTGRSRGGLAYASLCAKSHPPARDFMTACGSSLPNRFWRSPSSEMNSTYRLQLCLAFSCLSNRSIGFWQTASNGYRPFSRISTMYSLFADEPNALPWSDHLVPHTNQWIIFHVMAYKCRHVSFCRGKYLNQWSGSYHSLCKRG